MKSIIIIVLAFITAEKVLATPSGEQMIKKCRSIQGDVMYFENFENYTFGHLNVGEKSIDAEGNEIVDFHIKYGSELATSVSNVIKINRNPPPASWLINPIFTRGYNGNVAFMLVDGKLDLDSVIPVTSEIKNDRKLDLRDGISAANEVLLGDRFRALSGWNYLLTKEDITPELAVALINAAPESDLTLIFCLMAKKNDQSNGKLNKLISSVGKIFSTKEHKSKSLAMVNGILAQRLLFNSSGLNGNTHSDTVLNELIKSFDEILVETESFQYTKALLAK